MLELQAVSKRQGKRLILDKVNLSFAPGLTLLVGPSGAGKSTLLRICATADNPTSGKLFWDGKALPGARYRLRRNLGYAPQIVDLPEDLTGMEFLRHMAALKGLHWGIQVRELMEGVGLGYDADRRISTYSGGMRRRLVFVQAFLGSPRLLALDEPTAELDAATAQSITAIICAVPPDTVVIVATHLTDHFADLDAKVVMIADGQVREQWVS